MYMTDNLPGVNTVTFVCINFNHNLKDTHVCVSEFNDITAASYVCMLYKQCY